MKKIAKGDLTRKIILDTARQIFNEKGINLTIENLAAEMGMPKGRLTNHFSTKDKLFLAILSEYEDKLANKIVELKDFYLSKSLPDLITVISKVMDVQFDYRCAISFLTVLGPGQAELREQIQSGIKRNREIIYARLQVLVKNRLLLPDILEAEAFESFLFVYVNTMTQWVNYYDMYDPHKEYAVVKPLYIRGILEHVYRPYFTKKGIKELLELDYNKFV
jgi:AcrR family transcriptional regulator